MNIKEFSIDYFVKQNKDLLVCLGIFGALTIYLRQISSGECNSSGSTVHTIFGNFGYLDFGITSCLIIFLCLGLTIFFKLLGVYENTPRPFIFNFGNIIRMILIIPFGALMVSIFYYVTNVLSAPSQIIIFFIMGFLGAVAFFGSLTIFSLLTKNWKIQWTCSIVLFIILLFPTGWSLLTREYYLSSFLNTFNSLNFLYIIFYPIGIYLRYKIQKIPITGETSIQIALNQLKNKK